MTNDLIGMSSLGEGLVVCRLGSDMAMPLPEWERFVAVNNMDEQWLVVVPSAALISPDLVTGFAEAVFFRQDVEIFYADEVEDVATAGRPAPILKPGFDMTMLMADDYIGFPLIVRHATYNRLNGFRHEAGTARIYDFVLRAYADGCVIERIPKVFVAYKGRRVRADMSDRRRVLERWLTKNAPALEVSGGRTTSSLRVQRRFTEIPDVTLVVPTRQSLQLAVENEHHGRPHILNLLDSLQKTKWPMNAIRVLIGDDNADDRIYADGRWPFSIERIHTEPPAEGFNYAAKMNGLWRLAKTENIVLMNDDVVVKDAGWLEALLTFSMNEDVGGVGARLLYANGLIQHAGMAGGIFDTCAHAWMNEPADAPTYEDWGAVHREWSMVTGAVFATRKSAMEAVGGFDERLKLEFNDVDLCLRLRLLAYRIVCTPFAELIHYEKSSRGDIKPNGAEVALFFRRWSELLYNDPAFHPGFETERFDITPAQDDGAWYHKIQ